MKTAIKRAMEGGWRWKRNSNGYLEYMIAVGEIGESDYNDILLDPLFWQAFGRAEGWNDYHNKIWQIHYANGALFGWLAVWHHFIDHLADGGNVDDFFNNLLANSPSLAEGNNK